MTCEPEISVEQSARHELIARLQEMSAALQSSDDALFTELLHALLRRREEGFYLRIASIADELQKAFITLDTDQRWNAIASELPDSGARLDHVSKLTEQAAHHTLDLVEEGQRELKNMAESLTQLASVRTRILLASAGSESLMQVATEVQHIEPQLKNQHQNLRNKLSALAQAQEYQDLSGQILRRVSGVVRDVEAALLKLLDGRLPAQAASKMVDNVLEGPTIQGLGNSAKAADQDDADALLAMFMP